MVEQRVSAPFGDWNEMTRQGGKARWGYTMGSTGGMSIVEGKIQIIFCCRVLVETLRTGKKRKSIILFLL